MRISPSFYLWLALHPRESVLEREDGANVPVEFLYDPNEIGRNVAHMKQTEYKGEGPEAEENFERGMIALFSQFPRTFKIPSWMAAVW